MNRNQPSTWKTKPYRIAGLVLAGIGLALFPLVLTGCGHHSDAAEDSENSGPRLIEVETTEPARGSLTREIEQPGYLIPYELTPIYTKIAGFAEDWNYDLGDRVKKGALLVKLYVPEVEKDLYVKAARIKQAVADVKQARAFKKAAAAAVKAAEEDVKAKAASIRVALADVDRWQFEEERGKNLMAKGVFDRQTYDEIVKQLRSSRATKDEVTAIWSSSEAKLLQAAANDSKAEADVEVAEANQEVAQAAWEQWHDWLKYRYITAPYDGLVTLRNVAKGDFLQPVNSGSTSKAAMPLFMMMRTDIMRCTIEVPEMDAVLLKNGDRAEIYLQAMPGAPVIGTVERQSGHLDINSRTLRVEVHLKNPDNKFLPNMYAKVTIKAKMPNAWSLPAKYVMNDILADRDRRYCFVLEDGKDGKKIARKTFLEIGQTCDEGIPILRKQRAGSNVWENIAGTEQVVTTNSQALLDGQEVKLKLPEAH